MKTTFPILTALLSLGAPYAAAALYDPLNDDSNFGTPINSSITVGAGEVTILSEVASVDRVVDWMIDGTIRLGITEEGLIQVTPTAQEASGEWGLWGVFFDASDGYLTETNLMPYTDSTDVVNIAVPDFAPTETATFVLRFRVREAIGDGFTFTQINATPVPEPSAFALLGMSGLALLRRRRRS